MRVDIIINAVEKKFSKTTKILKFAAVGRCVDDGGSDDSRRGKMLNDNDKYHGFHVGERIGAVVYVVGTALCTSEILPERFYIFTVVV